MSFSIQMYQTPLWALLGLFCLCLGAALVALILLVTARVAHSKAALNGRRDYAVPQTASFRRGRRAAYFTLALFVAVFLLMLEPFRDSRVEVVNDDATDVLTVSGTVEALAPRSLLDGTLLYHTEDGFTFGLSLTVNGVQYHALSAGNLSVGDLVTLQYLPRSRCVLYLDSGENLPWENLPYPAVTAEAAQAAKEAALAAIPPVTGMRYPFEDYQRAFGFEVALLVFVSVIVLRIIVGLVMELRRRKPTVQDTITRACMLVGIGHLLAVGCSSIWNGYWQLLLEKQSDIVHTQGVIERIDVLSSDDGVKFSTEWGTQFGCRFTIGEETYFGMYEGELSVGDSVTLEYLPRSQCVTYIAQVEED